MHVVSRGGGGRENGLSVMFSGESASARPHPRTSPGPGSRPRDQSTDGSATDPQRQDGETEMGGGRVGDRKLKV